MLPLNLAETPFILDTHTTQELYEKLWSNEYNAKHNAFVLST